MGGHFGLGNVQGKGGGGGWALWAQQCAGEGRGGGGHFGLGNVQGKGGGGGGGVGTLGSAMCRGKEGGGGGALWARQCAGERRGGGHFGFGNVQGKGGCVGTLGSQMHGNAAARICINLP